MLLDITLPGRDGYWAAQQMRESEPGDWTPIIFLSGLDNDLDLWRGIEVGRRRLPVPAVKPIVPGGQTARHRRLLTCAGALVTLSADLHGSTSASTRWWARRTHGNLVNRRGFDRAWRILSVRERRKRVHPDAVRSGPISTC